MLKTKEILKIYNKHPGADKQTPVKDSNETDDVHSSTTKYTSGDPVDWSKNLIKNFIVVSSISRKQTNKSREIYCKMDIAELVKL